MPTTRQKDWLELQLQNQARSAKQVIGVQLFKPSSLLPWVAIGSWNQKPEFGIELKYSKARCRSPNWQLSHHTKTLPNLLKSVMFLFIYFANTGIIGILLSAFALFLGFYLFVCLF